MVKMVLMHSSLFNGERRIARPSEREMAEYGTPRRQFLKYAGMAALGAYATACGHKTCEDGLTSPTCKPPDPPPPPPPTSTYTVSGTGKKTFGREPYGSEPMRSYRASIGISTMDVTDGSYRLIVSPGTYNLMIDNGEAQIRRVITNVRIDRDTTLDFDALDRIIDIEQYRQMCMGINSPHPFGGGPVNPGRSIRLRQGVNPRVIVVRHPQIEQIYLGAFDTARSIFNTITRGRIAGSSIEYVDAEPTSDVPEGGIVVVFDTGSFRARPLGFNSRYIISNSKVTAPIGTVGNLEGVVRSIQHEYTHAIGGDHINNSGLMNPSGGFLTETETDDMFLKYMRDGGHEITEDREDIDGYDGGRTTSFVEMLFGQSRGDGRTVCELPADGIIIPNRK